MIKNSTIIILLVVLLCIGLAQYFYFNGDVYLGLLIGLAAPTVLGVSNAIMLKSIRDKMDIYERENARIVTKNEKDLKNR